MSLSKFVLYSLARTRPCKFLSHNNFKFSCQKIKFCSVPPTNPKPDEKSNKNDADSGKTDSDKGSNGFSLDPRRVIIGLTCAAGSYIFYLYVQHLVFLQKEKERLVVGEKIGIGGAFSLIDMNGKEVSDESFLGRWLLVYFGFTHCPDICPEELDKITEATALIRKKMADKDPNFVITPVFVSIDPERDTPEGCRKYLADFDPQFVGLTGSLENVQKLAKKYKVYMSFGQKGPDGDYIVDHSIITFAVNPKGMMVDMFSRRRTPEEIADAVVSHNEAMKTVDVNSFISFMKTNPVYKLFAS